MLMPVLASALSDITKAWRMRSVWIELAAEDVADPHLRSTLGPFWLLINYLALAGPFVLFFGNTSSIGNYPAYVAVGLLIWLYMSELIINALTLFVREQNYIRGTLLPISVYIMRLSMQFYIRLAYAGAGCLAILILSGALPQTAWIYSVLGLAVVIVTTPAVITVCAFAGAFVPDMSFAATNLIRLGLFLTPVFWIPGDGGVRDLVLNDWNPFTYFIDIVRLPVVSGAMPGFQLMVAACISLAFWLVATLFLGHYRKRVVFLLQ